MNVKPYKYLGFILVMYALFAADTVAQNTPRPCPNIVITGPAGISAPGDEMTFTVSVAGPSEKQFNYSWSVSGGTITYGQGTAAITVHSNIAYAGKIIEASVFIRGMPVGCPDIASESVPIDYALPTDCFTDEFGNLDPDDVRLRYDSFFIELLNNPSHLGVIILNLADDEKMDKGNPRVALILGHIKFREFDIKRITLQFERIDYVNTKLTRIPPGGRMPTCNDCTMVKASDL